MNEDVGATRMAPQSCGVRRDDLWSWVLLALLTLAYFCSTLDRVVISLLVDPIRQDLAISDTKISLLQGPAFLLVYSLSAIPLGFIVDRVHRLRLISGGIAGWSIATALCGLADSFWKLFAARAAVGIGEATLSPAAYSLIADKFSQRRLGLAYSTYAIGGFLGSGLSLILGGVIVQALTRQGPQVLPLVGFLQPWQLTFILFAIPGVVLAIVFATLREPARTTIPRAASARPAGEVAAFYRRNRGFLTMHHVMVGASNMVLLGSVSWVVPLFSRVHGWDTAAIGLGSGLGVMLGGIVGLLVSGVVGDRTVGRTPHARLLVCAASASGGAVVAIAYPLVGNPVLAMILFAMLAAFASVPLGVGNAALQQVVPGHIRGAVSAIYFFTLSIVTMFGPPTIAIVSDSFFPFPAGIAYATVVVLPLSMLLVATLSLACVRPYRRMLAEIGTA